jgi:hypothetical protein
MGSKMAKSRTRPDTSCTSEAVVGSSSDVTKSRPRHMSGECAATSSRQSSASSSPLSDSTHCDGLLKKSSGPTRGLVDALSQYFTPSDKRRSRVSLNALPLHSVVSQPFTVDALNSTRAVVADTTRRDDVAPPPAVSRSPIRNWKKARHLPNPNQTSSISRSNVVISPRRRCASTDVEPSNICDHDHRNSESSETKLPVVETVASATSHCDSLMKSKIRSDNSSTGVRHVTHHHSLTRKRTQSGDAPRSVGLKNTSNNNDEEFRHVANTLKNVHTKDRCRSNSMSEMQSALKRKRLRQTQLSALQDSLSHLFNADGERKRTARVTMFADQILAKRVRKSRSLSGASRRESESTVDKFSACESPGSAALSVVPADKEQYSSSRMYLVCWFGKLLKY